MGNRASCIPCNSLTAKLIFVDFDYGNMNTHNLGRIQLPASVAELMIEFPGYRISRTEDLLLNRRVKAMCADEQLRPREVYLMVSKNRVGSRIDERQVVAIQEVVRGRNRMLDSGLEGCKLLPKSDKEEGMDIDFLRRGRSRGQWRPLLDTIIECN